MSALGHYLKEEGIATVAISLIRPQTEHTRPPRALWVPFELGRPFGPPHDAAFQKRVILATLRMLEEGSGPVAIDDFPDDDPRARPDPAWRPPPLPAFGAGGALAARLEREIAALQPAHDRWVSQHGRSAVGLSGLGIADCGRYVGAWLNWSAPRLTPPLGRTDRRWRSAASPSSHRRASSCAAKGRFARATPISG